MNVSHPLLAAGLSFALLSCASDSDPSIGTELGSNVERDMAPAPSAANQKALIDGNTDFALNLYKEITSANAASDNIVVSPHSISTALAMTYAGAKGNTELQMADALSFTLPQDQLHESFNWLDLHLENVGANAKGADGGPFQLNIVNKLFGQEGFGIEAPFLDTLGYNYGAGVQLVDFVQKSEEARVSINAWVAERTGDQIDELLPKGILTPFTRLVLVNTIYLNAAWAHPFNKNATADDSFATPTGAITVPFVSGEGPFGYFADTNVEMVSLPLDGGELDMVFLLPSDMDSFETGLNAGILASLFDGLTQTGDVVVQMPKFEFKFDAKLREPMEALGMTDAFINGGADFTGISTQEDLAISAIVHSAFIAVTEAGVEAGAATAVVIGNDSGPAHTIKLDKPFLFAIRDVETSAVLFWGRVADPSAH